MRTKDEAEHDLAPYLSRFFDCILRALRRYAREQAPFRHKHSSTSESSLINDTMRDELEKEFRNERGITILRRGRTWLMDIKSRWIIKPKKLKEGMRSSNIPTQAALDFVNQEPPLQQELPGWLPVPTNLVLGYRRHGVEVMSSSIWLTCPNGADIEWTLPLALSERRRAPVVSFPTSKTAATKKKRVGPKRAGKKDSKTEKSDDADAGQRAKE